VLGLVAGGWANESITRWEGQCVKFLGSRMQFVWNFLLRMLSPFCAIVVLLWTKIGGEGGQGLGFKESPLSLSLSLSLFTSLLWEGVNSLQFSCNVRLLLSCWCWLQHLHFSFGRWWRNQIMITLVQLDHIHLLMQQVHNIP
jgi:hypothetical protein